MPSWMRANGGWLVATSFLCVICGCLVYILIDKSVTINYAWQEQKYQQEQIAVLQQLLLETSRKMKRSEIKRIIMERFGKNHLIKEDVPNKISVDNVILEFKGDSLVGVKSPAD